MIYGAAFSWNLDIPEFEDMNHQISKIAYGDETETLVSLLARISESWKFTWRNAVDWMEQGKLQLLHNAEIYENAVMALEQIKTELYQSVTNLPTTQRGQIHAYLIAVQGMILLQKIGKVLAENDAASGKTVNGKSGKEEYRKLAEALEYWLYDYKELWRTTSREAELFRIEHVICAYADWLRAI